MNPATVRHSWLLAYSKRALWFVDKNHTTRHGNSLPLCLSPFRPAEDLLLTQSPLRRHYAKLNLFGCGLCRQGQFLATRWLNALQVWQMRKIALYKRDWKDEQWIGGTPTKRWRNFAILANRAVRESVSETHPVAQRIKFSESPRPGQPWQSHIEKTCGNKSAMTDGLLILMNPGR